jgi:hypothetical protein
LLEGLAGFGERFDNQVTVEDGHTPARPQLHDAWTLAPRRRNVFAKVEVARQNDRGIAIRI